MRACFEDPRSNILTLCLVHYNLYQGLNQLARRGFASAAPTTKLFIDGKFVESQTKDWIDLHDPATNEIVTRVPKTTKSEMEAAMESSKTAYKSWSQTSILTRQAVMLKLQHIIKQNMGELAKSITKEQGKTLVDAEGDVLRGLRKYKYIVKSMIVMRDPSWCLYRLFRG